MSYRPVKGPITIDLGTFARHLNGDPVPHNVILTIYPGKLVDMAYKAASSTQSRSRAAKGGVIITLVKKE